jgi:hypothetical protein
VLGIVGEARHDRRHISLLFGAEVRVGEYVHLMVVRCVLTFMFSSRR